MPTPPRTSDRVSLARQHHNHHPQSPFGRARADPTYEFDLDTSQFPTPSKQNATRPRHYLRTGTLAGAYRAASRLSAMSPEDAALAGTTASPRRRRQTSLSALSPSSQTSNPPDELLDVYKRIEEDGTLADFVPTEDGWDTALVARPGSRTSHSSSRARERYTETGVGDEHADSSFLDDTGDHSYRRRVSDHTKDEQRLRRVTGKDSPVFSRARTGSRAALTADSLQRREEQEQEEEHHVADNDGDRGPSLNLPPTWGSRTGRRREWLRNVSRRSEFEPHEEQETSQTKLADYTAPRSSRISPRASERSYLPTRSVLGERSANNHVQEGQDGGEKATMGSPSDQNAPQSDGSPIPNTPIVVYKHPTSTKPSTTNRDSQELLRRLSRTENPKVDQVQTPSLPKLFERRIYEKTPRVTGAWIDTPMTERTAELPSHLVKDIVPASGAEKTDSTQQAKPSSSLQSQPQEMKPDTSTQRESQTAPQPAKPSRALIRPKLPRSALETVMEDVNSGKESLDIGDDTIESLQAILDDPTELKTEEEDEAEYEKAVLEKLHKATSEGNDTVDIDRLNDKLHSLKRNIDDVRRGLDSLEINVSREGAALSGSPTKSGLRTSPASQERDAYGTQPDGRVYAAIPLPRLWTRDPISRRIQLTKLSWLTIVSLTWYVTECIMCEQYCHPVVSDSCDGYCLQPDAPHFPWVTVTMLWRWSHLSTLLGPIFTVSVALFRLAAQLLGLWDGFVDDEPAQLGQIVGEIRINGTPVSFPWLSPPSAQQSLGSSPPQPQPVWTARDAPPPPRWGDDQASMDDDEYL